MCHVLKNPLIRSHEYVCLVFSSAPTWRRLSSATFLSVSLKYQAFVVVGVLGSTNMVYIPIGTEITASNTNIHLKGGKLECEKFCKILSCKGPETRLAAIPETAKYDDLLDNSFALYQDPTKYSNPGKYPPSRKPTRKRIPYMA